ncbi:MAG: Hpt domain-containing protein, partial [Opitutus sp.]
MSSEFSAELRGELLDEFYAECDDLITSVRRQLAELESSVDRITPGAEALEALFRNLHTLKGICAIAGLRVAEQLAHAMEDLLRGVTKGSIALTAGTLDVLGSAMQRFVQIVGSHRNSTPCPEITDLLTELKQWAPASAAIVG